MTFFDEAIGNDNLPIYVEENYDVKQVYEIHVNDIKKEEKQAAKRGAKKGKGKGHKKTTKFKLKYNEDMFDKIKTRNLTKEFQDCL